MTLQDRVEERLRHCFPLKFLEIVDESFLHKGHVGAPLGEESTHFSIALGGECFENLPSLAQHRLVYGALQDFFKEKKIHALKLSFLDAKAYAHG